MNTTAEMKIEISNARKTNIKDKCMLIEASKLSLTDTFMSYVPKTVTEMIFKDKLYTVIKNGIEDFYRPTMDPSFADKEKTKIHYMAGQKPAVGKSYNWWKETVKDSEWCIGTKSQYVAFLGVLIKKLVAKGWSVDEAWDTVCNDSKKLGHYRNSEDAKHQFEETGSREICGFFDLANTYKILTEEEGSYDFYVANPYKILAEEKVTCGFCLASGFYNIKSGSYPLAHLDQLCSICCNYHLFSVAWLVLKK